MASIIVNEDWKINVDGAGNHSPAIRKVNKETGKERYEEKGYFSTVEGALAEIVRVNVTTNVINAEDDIAIREYIDMLREERKALEAALRA